MRTDTCEPPLGRLFTSSGGRHGICLPQSAKSAKMVFVGAVFSLPSSGLDVRVRCPSGKNVRNNRYEVS